MRLLTEFILSPSISFFRNVRIYHAGHTGHDSSWWQASIAFTTTESHPAAPSLLLVHRRGIAIKYTKIPEFFQKGKLKSRRDQSCQHAINPDDLSSLNGNLRSGQHNRDHMIDKKSIKNTWKWHQKQRFHKLSYYPTTAGWIGVNETTSLIIAS